MVLHMVETHFSGFVLRDFVLGVFLAVFALAVCSSGLGNVNLPEKKND